MFAILNNNLDVLFEHEDFMTVLEEYGNSYPADAFIHNMDFPVNETGQETLNELNKIFGAPNDS